MFDFHTKGIDFDKENSGSEWWAQVRRPDGLNAGISLHWDKDEAVYARDALFVHPQISTVTYLTSGGSPTVVIPAWVNPVTNDLAETVLLNSCTS